MILTIFLVVVSVTGNCICRSMLGLASAITGRKKNEIANGKLLLHVRSESGVFLFLEVIPKMGGPGVPPRVGSAVHARKSKHCSVLPKMSVQSIAHVSTPNPRKERRDGLHACMRPPSLTDCSRVCSLDVTLN